MSNPISEKKNTGEFTGRHMALIMVAFFGVIISVNGFMAYMATASWTGILAKNGYVASQDFNAALAVRRTQDRLGFQSLLHYDDKTIVFSFRDSSDQALVGFDVNLQIGRPVNENEDRRYVLKEARPGIYSQKLKLAPGQWNADIFANDKAGRRYHRMVRLYVEK